MFSFLRKKSLVKRAAFMKAALTGAVLVLLTGFMFVSCSLPSDPFVGDGGINGGDTQGLTITTQPANTFWNVFTNEDGVKLTVKARAADGGTLSYQWYSNTTNSAADGTEISEAVNDEFTLTKTTCAENGAYYFYVIVTNANNDVSVTSNAVTVIVVGYPDTNYSDTHTMPSNLKGDWESEWDEIYTISDDEFSSGMDFGEGWSGYRGTIVNHRGNTEGTAGYITIQYTQNDWDEDAEDKYYVIFYKDLTDTAVTIAGAGSFAFNDPDFGASGGRAAKDEAEATYTVSAGYFETGSELTKSSTHIVHAVTPTISTQPVGGSWDVANANTFDLTVTATITDSGTLSYHWYSNTSATTTGGTAINTGGTSATLSLAKTNYTTNGNYYFYVVVTNTNNSVTGTKTASVTSNAATVTVTGNAFVLDAKWIGTWEPLNGGGDYRKFIAPNLTVLDFMPMGDDSITWGWAGTILDVVYFNPGETEGLFFVEFTELGTYGYQTVGTGDYTAFYFRYDRTDATKGEIYDLLDLAASMGGGMYGQPMFETLEEAKEAFTPEFVEPLILIPTLYYKSAP